jgi:hypothetical protein
MKILDWQVIEGESTPIRWTGDLSDDCTADWAGLLLRAEWMNGKNWWWAVTDKASGEEISSSNRLDAPCTSAEQARSAAEIAARWYLNLPTG